MTTKHDELLKVQAASTSGQAFLLGLSAAAHGWTVEQDSLLGFLAASVAFGSWSGNKARN